MSDIGSEARREGNVGIASVSRLMESFETRENNRVVRTSLSTHLEDCSIAEASNLSNEASGENSSRDSTSAACSASSHSS